MSLNQSVALTTAALYMALRAPQDRVQDLVELAEGFARKLTPLKSSGPSNALWKC
jgi:hypothetical protein